ncbi:LLM class F420-dependent oxidoreductase [Salinibacterium xinjiangense]|uniref:Probable F420-dependent oxidoreductase, Rv3520c family n=1 Tax=Salinibacterium xinjiangense TaxID=386302 RepID=A0A2C8YR74_9MICO|nr:LLM class F420-dependent oxidoreductase [Salinibacterium xinjiangense]GGK98559.1 LLM class F420-dependent oxidoreductase [Salinibacterium xinjiangense]SOE53064.1 probable F420-dependent oxidoreductase, Rv3520c family [Salinibacterium xinjiangense]
MSARLGVIVDYSDDFIEASLDVIEFERAGADIVSVAEAYSFDAVSRLGYLAAVTSTIGLSSGVIPIYSRTPTLIAMTAASLDSMSDGRFELGLGSSGGQVIEGFHGVPFTAPLGRLRETVEICRAVWRREKLIHSGKHYTIPLTAVEGTGLGKPLKLINTPVRSSIPIALAALTPRAVAQAAEIADGWLPLLYHPQKAHLAWGEALAEGTAKRSPQLAALDVMVSTPFFIGDDEQVLEAHRQRVALYVGGMGAIGANFYNDLATRYGYGDEAARVQELYLAGEKQAAADALPDDLVRETCLIGTAAEVARRLSALVASGVTTVMIAPVASTRQGRVEAVEAARDLLRKA